MTIKDIAKEAGVSVATVSRIINHKAQGLSEETRLRVLQVIEENDYVPYAKIRDRLLSGNDTLGLLIPNLERRFYASFAQEAQRLALAAGYSLLLCLTEYDAEKEKQAVDACMEKKASGVLFFPNGKASLALLASLRENHTAAAVVDCAEKNTSFPQIYRDLTRAAERSVQFLLERRYHRIGLVLREKGGEFAAKSILSGCRAALLKAGIPFDGSMIVRTGGEFERSMGMLVDAGAEALLCQDGDAAVGVYALAAQKCLGVPADIAVISLEDDGCSEALLPALSAVSAPAEEMARLAMDALFAQINKLPQPFLSRAVAIELVRRGSVGNRQEEQAADIAVVGSMNMDIVLKVPHMPHMGETVLASQFSCWPGGKGANQAFGVGRFGANAYMIGCLGNDRYGKQIYEQLSHENVHLEGVAFHSEHPTGTAYINVRPDGRNTIVVDSGANGALDPAYIDRQAALISKAQFCLVQMEIPLETVKHIITLCAARNTKVLLKPSPAKPLEPELLEKLFLLIPNEEELEVLSPGGKTVEERARFFLERGVKNVIVTLGEQGCLWMCKETLRRFPAHNFRSVDATGASDVFISCLAVLLAEGNSMEAAMEAANWAAGYSVTHEGVQNSIPHRRMLEDLMQGTLLLPE